MLVRVAVLTAVLGGLLVALPGTASAAPATVVTLTFDDGNADQLNAVPALKTYGLTGTFYIISGSVGAPNYLTRANLSTIAANGNEIGGHTVSHPDLTSVTADEAARQICNDRVTLAGWGYTPKSFAYPYASYNSTIEGIVANCGYNSARALGDIASAHGCAGCDKAGPIPPTDPYALEAVDEIDNTWTLQQMKNVVTAAETVGGWVPFTFHHVCAGTSTSCDSLAISSSTFSAFLSWLKTRPTTTSVKTVDQVVGGAYKPLVNGPPVSGGTTVVNASLEAAGGAGFPQCWFGGGYGTNTPAWTWSTDAHSGARSENLAVSGYSSGDAKLLQTFDLGGCSPNVTAGSASTISAFYKSTAVTQFALYYRDAAGGWYYWTSSPWFAAATTWTQATWTTPAAPAGATGISFGLSLFNNGTLTTDDYAIAPATSGAAAAKTLTSSSSSGSVTLTPAASSQRVLSGYKPGSHPHRRVWGRDGSAHLPTGLTPGTRIAVPILPD